REGRGKEGGRKKEGGGRKKGKERIDHRKGACREKDVRWLTKGRKSSGFRREGKRLEVRRFEKRYERQRERGKGKN
ncbi:hypothetical protein, partial [Streptococcus agalactiae]|uniref:hypothetical protein n=1 Tax=Streptococcus agalactiae TaxID=1311 RepID=UPI00164AC370